MPTRTDSILDSGYWDEVKPDWKPATPTISARAARYLTDIVRPSITKPGVRSKQPLRRTAYLDGLRGFAAFLVYWHHHQLWAREHIAAEGHFENGWGYNGNYYFASFPGIRTFFTGGHYAVTVFFVISGYVLSTKPLSLIQAGEYTKLGDNLASALFRRWPRLHIPVIVTSFLYMSSWHAFGIWTSFERKINYRGEVWNWYAEFKNFSFVFRSGGDPWFLYNFHAWSIPVEFRGSIAIYTALMAVSRCTRNGRLWCEAGLIFYFMYIVDGWFGAMFMSGMLLCDLDLLAAKDNLPSFFSKFESFKELIFYNLLVISVYLGGVPSHTLDIENLRQSPGWYYLSFLKPQAPLDYKWFYLLFAATFLVAAIPRIPWLKTFFETRFCQYLGRVSFALYLVHGPVLWILGDRFYAAVGYTREVHNTGLKHWMNIFPLPQTGIIGLDVRFLVPHLILLPVTFWLAEIVTRTIDEPSVKFSQWVYQKTLAPAVKS
ncbi:putative acyltransferase [Phaeomoniella chlamydospora]|uniref:Putative acyltransferase n=1 Tax=Phaeomoniella chlamydospora TaxID=158046 RepID=A0A0G2DVD5_PHACM|nr:putative acyltransferase [Phaeomoniella chlamydospora]